MRCLFTSLFLMIMLVLLDNFSLSAQTDSLKAGEYYQQAEALLLKGKTDKALKFFRKATTANEKLTAAWRGLGTCNELLENYDSTIVQYQKVIRLNPNFSRVLYFELGRVYYRNGQYQRALDYFYQFEKLQAKNIRTFGFNGAKEKQFEISYLENLPRSIQECKNALALLNFSNVTYIQNLGPSINTTQNEYFPYVSNNQKLLFYTSNTFDKVTKKIYNENLNFSYNREEWEKGKIVDSLITTGKDEGMSTFTRDGRLMIYTACKQEGVLANGCDLRKAVMLKDSVLSIETLEGPINSEFWESQAALSCDGNKLFFASNRKGGLGLTDLWMSERLPDGNWGEPKNLGNSINTKGYEEAPFITNDGKTLFFSSTGHLGMGEQDIFMSHWNEKGYWESAINLGPPINTAARELGFFLTSDNKTGYFASNKKEGFGGMDIYKFEMPNQFEVAPSTFVEGFIKDSLTNMPIETYVETSTRGQIKTDKNGRFFFCLPAEKDLSIAIKKEGYYPYQKTTFIPKWDNKSLFQITYYLQAIPTEIPEIVEPIPPTKDTLEKLITPIVHVVYFEFNDFGLNPVATKFLDKLFTTLTPENFKKVEVIGYADSTGSSDYNMDLSTKRAANVAKYLRLNGINSKEMITLGKGENNQFDNNRFNRRVEIRFQ